MFQNELWKIYRFFLNKLFFWTFFQWENERNRLKMNDNFVNKRNYFSLTIEKKLKNGSFTSDERTKWKNYSRAHLYITTTQITENLQQRPDLTTQLNYVDLNKFLLNLNRFRREVVEMSWHKLFLASTKSDPRNIWLE